MNKNNYNISYSSRTTFKKKLPLVQVVLVTHKKIGKALCFTLKKIFGKLPMKVSLIEIDYDSDIDLELQRIVQFIQARSTQQKTLILTDLFGATPSNIVSRLKYSNNIRSVSGLNLSMILNVVNYPFSSLQELESKAIAGGHLGIQFIRNKDAVCYP